MTTHGDFDLQPDPRILPMLGEINLAQWRCLAELIDNSVDGFLSALRGKRLVSNPQITVNVPTASGQANSRVTVKDNGPGMAPNVLETAVRAGWSGNNPVGSLGMFGMGFNIATARLGTITTVWTATAEDSEWHGLRIDFDELRRQRHFRTPHLVRPKTVPTEHGTEVTIERLKPEQAAWLAKPANQNLVRRELSRAYAAMLRQGGAPLSFRLTFNGRKIAPKNHCVWDEIRGTETIKWGQINAVITIDRRLPERPYCLACWQWLSDEEDQVCPTCNSASNTLLRPRHVHGWIGLQRFVSTSDFGIDFIRNGRKIELGSKELFDYNGEREYPIDDPRNRGRFVGEIHLDHCRVTYMKDRFDRTDPAWDEMVHIVRGDGPLRPDKAEQAGFGHNESPLFRLFQGFRRNSPHNPKMAGGWAKVIVVKDNDRAEEMAKEFEKGTPEYQTDEKWWQLVLEEDSKLLTPAGTAGGAGAASPPGGTAGGGDLDGFGGAGNGTTGTGAGSGGTASPTPVPGRRTPIPSLTREYRHDASNHRWDIKAFEVSSSDLALAGSPWDLKRRTTGEDEFLVSPTHPIFRSATMTQLDALLSQLAWSAVDLSRSQTNVPSFASVLADLRERYAGTLKLDPVVLKSQAESLLSLIAKSWAAHVDVADRISLFEEDLTSHQQNAIYAKMAARMVSNPRDMIAQGRFLEYAPPRVIMEYIIDHPELFFDGRCWDSAYSALEFPHQDATEDARRRVVRRYEALLSDLVWLIEQEIEDLAGTQRERILRAALALDLLVPVTVAEGH